jgi:hypothetical protein
MDTTSVGTPNSTGARASDFPRFQVRRTRAYAYVRACVCVRARVWSKGKFVESNWGR